MDGRADLRVDGGQIRLEPGTPVAVRNRLTGNWSGGFRVSARTTDSPESRYLLERGDGSRLPADIPGCDIIPVPD